MKIIDNSVKISLYKSMQSAENLWKIIKSCKKIGGNWIYHKKNRRESSKNG